MRKMLMLACMIMMTVMIAACGVQATQSINGSNGPVSSKGAIENNKDSNDPITLQVFFYQPGFTSEDFKARFEAHLTKVFPHISYELIDKTAISIEDLLASGTVPDIIFSGEKEVPQLEQLDIPLDLNGLIKQSNLDMTQFEPIAVSTINQYSDSGETLALAYALQYYASFYNKDIFDQFGVNYPTDGMTWDEQIALGKQLTRNVDGVQYYGIQAGDAMPLAQKFGLQLADLETKKALLDTEGFRKVFELGEKMYKIEGNLPPQGSLNAVNNLFTKEQNTAIAPYYGDGMINTLGKMYQEGNPMNWDMVSHPTTPENPGQSHELSFRSLVISQTSKHIDQAFEVIKEIATSNETQTILSKDGFQSALKADEYKQVFGANREELKGKNVAAIFKTTPLQTHLINKYDSIIKKPLRNHFYAFLTGEEDMNTALRLAQEEAQLLMNDVE